MALLTAPVIDSRAVIDSRGVYAASLAILGRDGSLAHTATTPPASGHVRAKPGTATVPGADGEPLEPKARTPAGYIETRSGRRLAYALMVNDAGAIQDIASDVADVFEEETDRQRHPPGSVMNELTDQSATLAAGCPAAGLAVPAAARTDPIGAAPTSHERKTR